MIEPIFNEYDDEREIDVLVIGAGLSGLQLAKDLSLRSAANIVVFEAGPNLGFHHVNWEYDEVHAQKLWQLLDEDPSFYRPWSTDMPPHYGGTSGLRRRLGGRSLYWHGGIIRLEPWALHPTCWPERIVNDLTVGVNGDLPIYQQQEQEVMSDHVTIGTEFLVTFINSIGYHTARPMPLAVRSRQLSDGTIRWSAYSPLDFWQGQSEAVSTSTPPCIACNTEVLSVLTDGVSVQGVRAKNILTGNVFDVKCPRVVLAAGTVENTHLAMDVLLSSGRMKRPLLKGLTDHLVAGCMYQVQLDQMPCEWMLPQMPSFAFIPGTEFSRFNLFVTVTPTIKDQRTILIDIWTIGEQLPQLENFIYLDLTQPSVRQTRVHANLSKVDQEMIEQQQQAVKDISTALLRSLGTTDSVKNHASYTSQQIENSFSNALLQATSSSFAYKNMLSYISPLGTVDHEGCTLPFGTMLRDTGEFIDIQGLYAVGPCTFPRMGAANPSLTTLALAKRTAYHLSMIS